MTTIHCEQAGCSASFDCDEYTFGVQLQKSDEGWEFLRCAPGEPNKFCPDHSGKLRISAERPYWLTPEQWAADKEIREQMRADWERAKAGTP